MGFDFDFIQYKSACLLLYKLIVLKVSFVVHSTIHLQKMPLVELSVFLHTLFLENKVQASEKNYGAMFFNRGEGRMYTFS